MDIICPKCRTEYEFENDKITATGVTVKCTTCNYVFKVRRKEVVETEPVDFQPTPDSQSSYLANAITNTRPWLIRTNTGQSLTFKDLTTLHQWITARRVGPDDRISKGGESWKRLGDIAELAPLFQAVEGNGAAKPPRLPSSMVPPPPPSRAVTGSQAPVKIRGSGTPSSAVPPVFKGHTQKGIKPQGSVTPRSLAPIPNQPNQKASTELDEPAFAVSNVNFQPVGPSAAWESGGGDVMSPGITGRENLDELVPKRRVSKILGWLVLVLALIGVGFMVSKHFDQLKQLFSGESQQNNEIYQTGRKFFLLDDEENLKRADQEFAKAPSSNALVQAARAEVFTTWAQHLRDQAELLERTIKHIEQTENVQTPSDPSPAAKKLATDKELGRGAEKIKSMLLQVSSLKDQADRKLSLAELYVAKAMQEAPNRGEVRRAMADYLRLKGSSSKEILAQLAEARKKLPDDPESLYVEGMMWAGLKEDHRAEALLTDALKQTQARYSQILVRAAIELGMIYFKAGNRNEARSQVEAVFQHNRNHQWARNLLESITALSEPTAIANVNSQGGTEDGLNPAIVGRDGGRPIETGSGGGQSHEGIHGGQGGAPNTYEGLVKEGNKLSERGHTMQAMKFFQRALELKPNGVEALTGLGYCHLDQERFAAALASFKRALNLVPADGDAMIGMAEAYKVQGNLAKALDYYRAYLQAYPAGRKAILARQNVTELERQIGGTPSGTTTSPPPSAPPPSAPPPSAPPASGEAPPTSGTAPESGNISGNPETSAP